MSRRRRALATLAVLALPAVAATAEEPSLRLVTPERPATIGDRVAVALELTVPADCQLGGEPRFPAFVEHWGDAEVVTVGTVERLVQSGTPVSTVYRQVVELALFRTGEIPLPAVEAAVPCSAGTRTVASPADARLEVQSLLPAEGEMPPPRPPAPPRQLPLPVAYWWLLAGLAAACVALAWWLARLRRARRAAAGETPVPAIPPFPELLARLDALGTALDERPAERLHVELSLALRRYLGRELGFHALESSTSEIQRALARRQLPLASARAAVRLLRDCDAVKFARQPSPREQTQGRLGAARELAAAIDAHLHPAVVAPPVGETGRERAA